MSNPLFPGVYVDELRSGPRPIEGVPTATTGMAGLLPYGPVSYPGGPAVTSAPLVTSLIELERSFGPPSWLELASPAGRRPSYTAHAAQAFFTNGGQRLHIARVFVPRVAHGVPDWGVASARFQVLGHDVSWRARWPGQAGNLTVETTVERTGNVANVNVALGGIVQADGATSGTIVEVIPAGRRRVAPPVGNAPLAVSTLAEVSVNATTGRQLFRRRGRSFRPKPTDVIQIVTARVAVSRNGQVLAEHTGVGAHTAHASYAGAVFALDAGIAPHAAIWLDLSVLDMAYRTHAFTDLSAHLLAALQQAGTVHLTGGHDGALPSAVELAGTAVDASDPTSRATGLCLLDDCDAVAIVALPDAATLATDGAQRAATQTLIDYAERHRYRFAVLDGPAHASLSDIRAFRRGFDSTRGALYHPWVEITDPATQQPLLVPPSGVLCGVYARTDIARGVHTAPANEALRGITGLATAITTAEQDVLNPDGINALRTLPGRGMRVWGARTISGAADYRYVSVRRLLNYLERSIALGTEWVVFEPNDEALWTMIVQRVEDFLHAVWRGGALQGATTREGYFVRCDRSTMTQADVDAGRVVVEIGVAPIKPAEFLLFRVAQWSARV